MNRTKGTTPPEGEGAPAPCRQPDVDQGAKVVRMPARSFSKPSGTTGEATGGDRKPFAHSFIFRWGLVFLVTVPAWISPVPAAIPERAEPAVAAKVYGPAVPKARDRGRGGRAFLKGAVPTEALRVTGGVSVERPLSVPSSPDAAWESMPLFGGEVISVVQDPFSADTVYVGTRDGGVFKTVDGGAHWSPARQGLTYYPIRSLTADPVHSGTLYAGTDFNGVWKSVDGASSWQRTGPGISGSLVIFVIAVDPSNPDILYAAGAGGAGLCIGAIYKSVDGGANWAEQDQTIPRYESGDYINGVFSLAIDPLSPGTLYAGTNFQGLHKTLDGGLTWSFAVDGLPLYPGSTDQWWGVNALAFNPHVPGQCGMIYQAGGYYTRTGAGPWIQVSTESALGGIGADRLHYHPSNPSILYATPGLYRSSDGGITWESLSSAGISDIAFHPSSPGVMIGAVHQGFHTPGGALKSTDGGTTWVDSSSGITAVNVRSVAVDPSDPRNLYAGTGEGLLYASHDAGVSWTFATDAADPGENNFDEVNDILVDPVDPAVLYLATFGGIFKSGDHGATFRKCPGVYGGVCLARPTGAGGTLYMGNGDGVWKTIDGGDTWVEKNQGLPLFGGDVCPVLSLAVDPAHPGTLWAGMQYGGGIAKSTDGGDHWESRGLTDDNFVYAIGLSPADSDVILAGAGFWTGSIYKSDDGGLTWQCKLSDIAFVRDFAFDPRNPLWVYAATEGYGVLRSMDGGETWSFFDEGIFYPLTYSIAVSAEAEPLLLSGSYGSGLFRMRPPRPTLHLRFPRLSIVPGQEDEGYGFVNPGPIPAAIRFTAYGAGGNVLDVSDTLTLPAGSQAAYQMDGVLDLPGGGEAWVEAESDAPGLRSFFLTERFAGSLAGLDGARAFTETLGGQDIPRSDSVFPGVKNQGAFSTEIFVANPGDQPVQAVFTGYDGTAVHPGESRVIAAHGFLRAEVPELFAGGRFDGALAVRSDGALIGNAVIRDADRSVSSLNLLDASASNEYLYAPHVVRWPSLYETEITLFNAGSQSGSLTVTTYYRIQGETEIRHTFRFLELPVRQAMVLDADDLGLPAGKVSEGWTLFETWGARLVSGSVAFGDPVSGRYRSMLPLETAPSGDFHFAQVANGSVGGVSFFTGIALVNPQSSAAQVTVEVFASDGIRLGLATLPLGANGKWVGMLSQLPGIGTLPDQASGYVHVTSDQPLVSFALFGDTAMNFLSAVPAQR